MKTPISITSIASISPLGRTVTELWGAYKNGISPMKLREFGHFEAFTARLDDESSASIEKLRTSNSQYEQLDKSVLMAIYAAREAVQKASWKTGNFGINIGSSRGVTDLFETYHANFLKTGKAATLSSPTTTLGNISSWVAQDLQSEGPTISHSITCSTALHALLNGIAWLQADMNDKFLVGGAEAPLTEFTLAQMKALKIYAPNEETDFPCRALDLKKKRNTMVLGEGAAVACLEKGVVPNALALIEGIGYATETLTHSTSISKEAVCFQKSMKMACKDISLDEIDAIIMHAPGTVQGDLAEYKAIQKVFGNTLPAVTSTKHLTGHTFATSGMLSVELAILMLQHQEFIGSPFLVHEAPKKLFKILVNAVGFGGNAVSVVVGRG